VIKGSYRDVESVQLDFLSARHVIHAREARIALVHELLVCAGVHVMKLS
jgi:hypothetical protein